MENAVTKADEHAVVSTDAAQVLEIVSRAAADPNTDIDKLERLMSMYERISAKNAEAEFYAAFSTMQSKIPVITEKGEIKVNDVVRSRFAKNEDIQEVLKPILQEHGFTLSFRNEFPKDGYINVIGTLAHKAGHKIEGCFLGKADTSGSKNDIQSFGSSQSYGQRYVTRGLLNIVSRGEDNDGGNPPPPTITVDQANQLSAKVKEVGADLDKFLAVAKVEQLEDIRADRFDKAVEWLDRYASAKKK